GGCTISQPNFKKELDNNNVIFRIPTPLFGAGLIEAIDDAAILANRDSFKSGKSAFGISGRENRTGNDGSITRFGWKAQNKSLVIFAGEAYNVEQGVTNEVFPNARETATGCDTVGHPEDSSLTSKASPGGDVTQRIFFLHDGRTSDLLAAIQAHASRATGQTNDSEANASVAMFNGLQASSKQDILNFLRSL